MYRRRVVVPPEAAFVHRLLAPIAAELNGRVYDDDGRLLIEWLERHWPHDIVGHGRSDGFRWSVSGLTDEAHILVLITQSLLGARTQADLDVIVAPRVAVPQPGSTAGVHFSQKGELSSLESAAIRSLVQAGMAAIMTPTKRAETPTTRVAARRTRAEPRWTGAVGFALVAVLTAALFLDKGLVAAAIAMLIMLGAVALRLSARARRASSPTSDINDETARLEEGRDIRDYDWGSG